MLDKTIQICYPPVMPNNSKLVAQVRVENKNAEITNRLVPLVLAWLTPFVGEKIYTKAGDLTNKVAKSAPVFEEDKNFGWWLKKLHTSLYLKTRCSDYYETEKGDTLSVYAQLDSTYLGDVQTEGASFHEQLHLIKLIDNWKPLKSDYSVDAVEVARLNIQKIQEESEKQIRFWKDSGHIYIFGER